MASNKKKKKIEIKDRKTREKEFKLKYDNINPDAFDRLLDYLGEYATPKLFQQAINRNNEIVNEQTCSYMHITFIEHPIESIRGRIARSKSPFPYIYIPNAEANLLAVENLIGLAIDDLRLISTPVQVELTAYYPTPKATHPIETILFEAKKLWGIGYSDFDNCLKAYCDMIQGYILSNDDLVVRSVFEKRYSLLPRVELSLTFFDKCASKYIYTKIKSRTSYDPMRSKLELIGNLPRRERIKKGGST